MRLEQTLEQVLHFLVREDRRGMVRDGKVLQLVVHGRQVHRVKVKERKLVARDVRRVRGRHDLQRFMLVARVGRRGHGPMLRLHVPREVPGRTERLATVVNDTRVDAVAIVDLLVFHEHVFARENARAPGRRTLHLVQRVQSFVACQVPRRTKAFATRCNGTLMRLLPRVRLHVFVEREFPVEATATERNGTRKRAILLRVAQPGWADQGRSGTDSGRACIHGVSLHGEEGRRGGSDWQAMKATRFKWKNDLKCAARFAVSSAARDTLENVMGASLAPGVRLLSRNRRRDLEMKTGLLRSMTDLLPRRLRIDGVFSRKKVIGD